MLRGGAEEYSAGAAYGAGGGEGPARPRPVTATATRRTPNGRGKGGILAMRLRKSTAKLLSRERVCRVATVGHGGVPHVVAVCHVLADGKVYFATENGSQKVRNLEANPHMALLVDLYSEDWKVLRGVMVQGTARLVRRGPEFRKIRGLLYEKYPQYPQEAALEESGDTIVEVTPVRVSSWGVD